MNPLSSPLLTDLYQLTMLQAYMEQGMEQRAVFELFVRKLPHRRNFLVAAGLQQALEFIENFQFSAEELEWIARSGLFRPEFPHYLEKLRFTGDVHAMAEGTVFFPDEPILRISAPLPQAQLLETRLINLIHFETLVASKAARSVLAAPGKLLVDFGLRRAHGAEAGLLAARASYLAGFAGSATTLAGALFDIPLYGTMAHSYIQAHENELLAFEHFACSFPSNAVLLIDTYDTEAAAAKVVAVATSLRERGITVRGVRIDSGDLADHARQVRRILDEAGLTETLIFASGNLDEYQVGKLFAESAPIDGYGIGTSLVTSGDAPSLDCVYKLQEYGGQPRRKRSEGKSTWPGRKQVYRHRDSTGQMCGDVLTLEGDFQEGEPLIQPYMREGQRLLSNPPLSSIRDHALKQYERLPDRMKSLEDEPAYPVAVAEALQDMAQEVDRRFP